MAGDIGLSHIAVVGNKIDSPANDAFIRSSLPDFDILGMIPYIEKLRLADREGQSVLDALDDPLRQTFQAILEKLGG